MDFTLLLVAAVVLLAAPRAEAAGKLPDSYQLCKRLDPKLPECLKSAVQKVLKELIPGIPSLGVQSIDPLEVSAVDISQGSGPISINLKFRNAKVYGLSNGNVLDVTPNLDKYEVIFRGVEPSLRLESDYEIDGKILVLPVTGKGRCNISFTGLSAKVGPKGVPLKKDGETYMDVNDFKTDIFSLEGMTVNFENLFNGDKVLGEAMNTLLNENWKDFWLALRPAFEGTFGEIFKQYSIRVFSNVPFKDIFLD